MINVDLHTHSVASPDGGISSAQYQRALQSGLLDFIAVTDHNRIDFATSLQAELGEVIIIGEEIMTRSGEIIGLYLKHAIPPQLSLKDAIAAIKSQNGIVYVPHPFETVRKGVSLADLQEHADSIDCIEVHNGRAVFQNRSAQAIVWAGDQSVAMGASSDAHGWRGLGSAYAQLPHAPTRENFLALLPQATLVSNKPALRSLLYPKYHKLRKSWTISK